MKTSSEDIIKIKNDIEPRVILDLFSIKYRGKSVCCPFHNDHRPSATINKDGIYCHPCGQSYDIIDIVMRMLKCSFEDALTFLKDQTGKAKEKGSLYDDFIKIKDTPTDSFDKSKKITEKGASVLKFFFNQLELSERGKQYLEKRGISNDISEKYKLRSLEEHKKLLGKLFENFQEEHIRESGILSYSDTGRPFLTPFREGILIPFLDENKEPEYLIVRSYENEPKYIKPKGIIQPVFTGDDFVTAEEVFCIEGAFDCFSYEILSQKSNFISFAGLPSMSGIESIMQKYPEKKIVLALDNDERGIEASNKIQEVHPQIKSMNWQKLFKENGIPIMSVIKDFNELLLFIRRNG